MNSHVCWAAYGFISRHKYIYIFLSENYLCVSWQNNNPATRLVNFPAKKSQPADVSVNGANQFSISSFRQPFKGGWGGGGGGLIH